VSLMRMALKTFHSFTMKCMEFGICFDPLNVCTHIKNSPKAWQQFYKLGKENFRSILRAAAVRMTGRTQPTRLQVEERKWGPNSCA
jgi:hypothetical protein